MNIATDKYTEEQILRALRSNAREVYYEYTIQSPQGETLQYIEIEDGTISFDSTADVMRTFSGTCRKSDVLTIDSIDYRLVPWMCLKMNGEVIKWPLGKFLIEPDESGESNYSTIGITGYDLGKIALDDLHDSRLYMQSGVAYTAMAQQIANYDYDDIDMDSSAKAKQEEKEWDIGTSHLEMINDLLTAISYCPLYFDEHGTGHIKEFVLPQERSIERTYRSDSESVIIDGISKTSNKFEIPNKFVRYVENADSDYLISTYINSDPTSPYSTVNRGRTICDIDSVDDIATQGDLDNYVRKYVAETMQGTETLEFTTMNMPGHGYVNCIFVDVPEYGIKDKYVELQWEMSLTRGGTMTHYCEKAITV